MNLRERMGSWGEKPHEIILNLYTCGIISQDEFNLMNLSMCQCAIPVEVDQKEIAKKVIASIDGDGELEKDEVDNSNIAGIVKEFTSDC